MQSARDCSIVCIITFCSPYRWDKFYQGPGHSVAELSENVKESLFYVDEMYFKEFLKGDWDECEVDFSVSGW